MNKPETLLGWPLKRIIFPDGEQIVCCFCKTGSEPELSLHDINHNVFRLNKKCEIVWQVKRDDSIYPGDWWEGLHRHARERGEDGAREPFMYIDLITPSGKFACVDATTGMPADIQTWKDGCTIHLSGSAYQNYILDPETGIAKNVTDWPVRPW